MNAMIERLIATHRLINREIRRELRHRLPDGLRLKQLKTQRLAIKDRLFRHYPEAAHLRRATRVVLGRLRAVPQGG